MTSITENHATRISYPINYSSVHSPRHIQPMSLYFIVPVYCVKRWNSHTEGGRPEVPG